MTKQVKTLSHRSETDSTRRSLSPEVEKAVRKAETDRFRSTRELIETLAIALFLSMIFKFFEAEAYVIPTGSMAPTLMGRHKDVHCQACGFPFQVSASEERDRENRPTETHIVAGTCPQCQLSQTFKASDISYSGDRVLVNKFLGDFQPIERWDVTVFRSPPDPKTNYIKRVVGLPNETIRIQYGDLFIQKEEIDGTKGAFEIARKPLVHLLRMLQTVYDNDYQSPTLRSLGWPDRWRDERAASGDRVCGWQTIEEGRGFYFSGEPVPVPEESRTFRLGPESFPEMSTTEGNGMNWLRYRHLLPTSDQWREFVEGRVPADLQAGGVIPNNPQLITDRNAYNSSRTSGREPWRSAGYNWSGDLALAFEFTPEMTSFRSVGGTENASDVMILELIKGGVAFQARFDFSRDEVTLSIPDIPEFQPETTPFSFQPGKNYRILFANIDEQMRIVIDGKELPFLNGGKYDYLCAPGADDRTAILPRNRDPDRRDLSPAGIAVNLPATVRHLRLMRDIYYIALGNRLEPDNLATHGDSGQELYKFGARDPFDHFVAKPIRVDNEERFAQFFSDPSAWTGYGNTRSALFPLGEEEYFTLGDNSSNSEDARSWSHPDAIWPDGVIPNCVGRELVLGKAVCVYWPHGLPIPGTRLPFIPNFGKMRKIN